MNNFINIADVDKKDLREDYRSCKIGKEKKIYIAKIICRSRYYTNR